VRARGGGAGASAARAGSVEAVARAMSAAGRGLECGLREEGLGEAVMRRIERAGAMARCRRIEILTSGV
jgi:hypothetical protein